MSYRIYFNLKIDSLLPVIKSERNFYENIISRPRISNFQTLNDKKYNERNRKGY